MESFVLATFPQRLERLLIACIFFWCGVLCLERSVTLVTATAPRVMEEPLPVHYHGRSLASTTAPTCPQLHTGSSWGPIRIGYEIVSYGRGNAPASWTNHLETTLMKNSLAFWSRALKTRRYSQSTPLDRDSAFRACGYETSTLDASSTPRNFLVDNIDLYLFIDIDDEYLCTGNTLAAAASCYVDQCGRPIAGSVTLCTNSGYGDLNVERNLHFNYANVVHEIGHVLFFFELLWPNFVNDDGTLKLQDRSYYAFDCYGRWNLPYNTGRRWYPGLHEDGSAGQVLGIVEHGNFKLNQCTCPYGSKALQQQYNGANFQNCLTDHPHCQYEIRTPKVVEKAREYFNCPSLTGMPLENTPTSRCSAYGNHWEQRIHSNEMFAATGNPDDATFVSTISLAFAEDTGWYQADYSRATIAIENLHWGYKRGCAFVTDECVSDSAVAVDRNFYCTVPTDTGCAPHRRGRQLGFCALEDSGTGQTLPTEFQYWANNAQKGGSFGMLDHCPRRYAYSANTGDCALTNAYLQNLMFNAGTSDSKCFNTLGTITSTQVSLFANNRIAASCYRVVCGTDYYDVYGRYESGSRQEVRIARCDANKNFVPNTNDLSANIANTQLVECNSFSEVCNRVKSAHLYGGLHENELALSQVEKETRFPVAAFYGRSTEICLQRQSSAANCPTYCQHFFPNYCATNSGMCVSSTCKQCMDSHNCSTADCRQQKCKDYCVICSSVVQDKACETVYTWGYTPAYCPASCNKYYARFCSTNAGPGMCVDPGCYECDTNCVSQFQANPYFDIQTCWASCETCPAGSFCGNTPVSTTPHFDPNYDPSATTTAKPPALPCLTCSTTAAPTLSGGQTTTTVTTTQYDPANVPTACRTRYAIDAVPYPSCPESCGAHYADFCQPLQGPGMCVPPECKLCDQKCAVDAVQLGWTNAQYQSCYMACGLCPKWQDYCSPVALAGTTIVTKADIEAQMNLAESIKNNTRITTTLSSTSSTTTPKPWGGCATVSSANPTAANVAAGGGTNTADLQCPSVSGSLIISMQNDVSTVSSALTTQIGPSIATALAATLNVSPLQITVLIVRFVQTGAATSKMLRDDEIVDSVEPALESSSVFPGQHQIAGIADPTEGHRMLRWTGSTTRALKQQEMFSVVFKGMRNAQKLPVDREKNRKSRKRYPAPDRLDIRKTKPEPRPKALAESMSPAVLTGVVGSQQHYTVRNLEEIETQVSNDAVLDKDDYTQHGVRTTEREISVKPAGDDYGARNVGQSHTASRTGKAERISHQEQQGSPSIKSSIRNLQTQNQRQLEAIYEVRAQSTSDASALASTLQTLPSTGLTALQQNLQTQLVSDLGTDFAVATVSEGSITPMTYTPPTSSGSSDSGTGSSSGSNILPGNAGPSLGNGESGVTLAIDASGATGGRRRAEEFSTAFLLSLSSVVMMVHLLAPWRTVWT